MISRIEIEGLGPHQQTSIDFVAMGRTEIHGQSEAGKSTTLAAVCFALWGSGVDGYPLDLRAINDGAQRVAVILTLVSGSIIRRTLRRSKTGARGKITRSIETSERGEIAYATEKEFAAALKGIGEYRDAVRTVLVPFSWVPLADGPGKGRPLRDLLVSILPAQDMRAIVGELMKAEGWSLGPKDPITSKEAEAQRTSANRARDKSEGDVERLRLLVKTAEQQASATVDEGRLGRALALAALSKRWESFWVNHGRWEGESERRARQGLDVEEWRERREALGMRPIGATEPIDSARKAERAAIAMLDEARRTAGKIEGDQAQGIDRRGVLRKKQASEPPLRLVQAREDARKRWSGGLAALEGDNVCPVCKRPDWESKKTAAAEDVTEGEKATKKAEQAIDDWRAAETKRIGEERERVERDLSELAKQLEGAVARVESAEAAIEKARREVSFAIEVNAGAADWERASASLGSEPSIDDQKWFKPSKPEGEEPSQALQREALSVIDEEKQNAGRQVQRGEDLSTLRATLRGSESAYQQSQEEAERLQILVLAIRAAPSVAAQRTREALGDLGPVSLEWPKEGGCRVLVDRRPWSLASTGRQVQADACLRAGIRSALRMSFLPVFVDQVQDVGGFDPAPIAPPVVLLRTTERGALDVAS